jgi:hypothetical protein
MELSDVPRKYTGTTDAPGTATAEGCMELMRLLNKTWGFKFHGGFVNRKILSGSSKGKWSVHATGRAIDVAYPKTRYGRRQAVQVWVWLMQNTSTLQIEGAHDYGYRKQGDTISYGRGYQCTRGEGCEPGAVVEFDAKRNAGSFGGNWLHIELAPQLAHDKKALRDAWMTIEKPQPLLKAKARKAR